MIPASMLIIHYCAGALGLLSGAAALYFRKGSRLHRAAGNVFFISMLIMSGLGGYLAYFKPETISVLAGIFTFYLVATAWATVMRKEEETGLFEIGAGVVASAVAAAYFFFGVKAANSALGSLHGFPPETFYIFGTIATLAAATDFSAIVRGGVSGVQRIARHLWRMCTALFIATASFFLGQMQVFPEAIRRIEILAVPVLLVLVLLFFWLVRVLFTGWYKKADAAS